MVFSGLDQAFQGRVQGLRPPRLIGAAEAALRSAYQEALRRPFAETPLSGRNTGEYAQMRRLRRKDLEAILRVGVGPENRETAMNLICAICEESSWADLRETGFEDDAHPAVDRTAAETGALLAWVYQCANLDVKTRAHLAWEIRRRILSPLMAHEDYPCLAGEGAYPVTILCAAVTCALFLAEAEPRLHAVLRYLTGRIDEILQRPFRRPLAETVNDQAAATALWLFCRRLGLPMEEALPFPGWMDALLAAHLGGRDFMDPMGEGVRRGLNATDVFLMGHAAGDRAIETLGAALYRDGGAAASCVNGRLLEDYTMNMTVAPVNVPRLRHAALPGGSLMSARGGSVFVALTAGGRGNGGGLYVWIGGSAMLVSCPGDGPVINGLGQLDAAGSGESQFGDVRANMAVELTGCYPAAEDLRYVQRTVMLERREGATRVVDMIECRNPGQVRYTFRSPHIPAQVRGGLQLGPGILGCDAGAEIQTYRENGGAAFREGLFRIEMTLPLRRGSNLINFTLSQG